MVFPFPGRRDLLLLAAGLLLGLVLGPPLLGAAAPTAYIALFGGTEAHEAAEAAREQAASARAAALAQLGLGEGEGALPEGPQREQAEARYAELDRVLTGAVTARYAAVDAAMNARAVRWVLGLLIALAGVFVAEVLASPEPPPAGASRASVEVPPALRRLTTVRYALMAGLLAVVLARATLYEEIPWIFSVLLLAVALGAAWVPLHRAGAGRAAGAASGPGNPAAPPPVDPPADRADGAAG
ncbi:hypothetical protein [Phycisphaera mikurensis]|uniref:DUF4400 domain-containing protein n=1 Tax=Phycisphaera mikurensis (strain NBRC 102666 / KCTC 22515 / FYK2301M01) TaxID=1142394 RepID=I0IB70_PHYMF|nr:hypothetical protein [Phycisphaera mikurensis]MBB6443007.1 hypothetical protein [Phycisphaera mikurensis]BAM02508.1 hypothetical protein PSMK_03490 [Phycisphaera mikurensis NBRC 102666]